MKKKLLIALGIALLALLFFAIPAFAWTSVSGQCIDSDTLQGWAYGGTVTVYGNVSGSIGSNTLDGSGNFSVTLTIPPTDNNTTLWIVITYNTGPLGKPGTHIETIPFIPTGTGYWMGYVETGTGANAVTLAQADAESPSMWLPVALAVVALVCAGGVVLLLRRRRVA